MDELPAQIPQILVLSASTLASMGIGSEEIQPKGFVGEEGNMQLGVVQHPLV